MHLVSLKAITIVCAGYIGTIFLTLYSALVLKSYVLSLVCSGLQVVALLYYVTSYFPGGSRAVKFLLSLFYQAVLSCFGTIQAMVLR